MFRLTLVLACIFSACARAPAHVKATDVAMKKFCQKASQDKQIKMLGCGGFFDERKVRGFYADFESNKQLSKEEARALLTDLVSTCIHDLNLEEKLLSYVIKTPISFDHVSISIVFVGDDRKPYSQLSQIHIFENKVYYSVYDVSQNAYVCTQSETLNSENPSLESNVATAPQVTEIESSVE